MNVLETVLTSWVGSTFSRLFAKMVVEVGEAAGPLTSPLTSLFTSSVISFIGQFITALDGRWERWKMEWARKGFVFELCLRAQMVWQAPENTKYHHYITSTSWATWIILFFPFRFLAFLTPHTPQLHIHRHLLASPPKYHRRMDHIGKDPPPLQPWSDG